MIIGNSPQYILGVTVKPIAAERFNWIWFFISLDLPQILFHQWVRRTHEAGLAEQGTGIELEHFQRRPFWTGPHGATVYFKVSLLQQNHCWNY